MIYKTYIWVREFAWFILTFPLALVLFVAALPIIVVMFVCAVLLHWIKLIWQYLSASWMKGSEDLQRSRV